MLSYVRVMTVTLTGVNYFSTSHQLW